MSLAVHRDAWEARLPALIPTYEVEKNPRYHYLCQAIGLDWRSAMPAGYTVRQVDRALLHAGEDVFPNDVRDWMDIEEKWGTEENFLSRGVSFVALCEGQVVAWCTPDCVAGDRIDVGIFTHPAHRRKGLAAATAEHCLRHGFSAVGWHCNADNVASWKTAERVGFERNREYARTLHYYEQVFAQREDNPDHYYHLVASAWGHVGNRDRAFEYLLAAIDHGWKHLEWTKQQPEFYILGDAQWDAVVVRESQAGG